MGRKLAYAFRGNTSPLARQMTVRSGVKLICNTVALWCYHVAGKIEASCTPQPYAPQPLHGIAVWRFNPPGKICQTHARHTLAVNNQDITASLVLSTLYAEGVGTKCLL